MFRKIRILLDGAGDGKDLGGGTALTGAPAVTPPTVTPPTVTPPAGEKTWLDDMPKEFQDSEVLKRYKSPKELAAAYLSAQKIISSDKIAVPGKHATDEDWKAVYTKLGVPEKIEDYKLELAKDAGVDEKFVTAYKAQAHALGILPSQAQKMLDWAGKHSKESVAAFQQDMDGKLQEGLKTLKTEWGNAYDSKLARAAKLVQDFGSPEFIEYLNSSRMGNDARLIKMLDNMASKFLGEGAILGDEDAGQRTLTPQQAKAQVDKIMGDKAHPYFDKSHPGHKSAVDEMKQLFETMHPAAKSIQLRGAARQTS